jgi:hypothetical protein
MDVEREDSIRLIESTCMRSSIAKKKKNKRAAGQVDLTHAARVH